MAWSGGLIDWIEGNTAYVSCVFSWQLDKAYMRCVYLKQQGYKVMVGGPAVYIKPEYFDGVADVGYNTDALERHNKDATFTSRGCIRNCSFCLVPKIEGKLVELSDWKVKPIICDNNLLATSQEHFDKVIDHLLEAQLRRIDFNQGLDARILTSHHAKRFVELPKDTVIRLAWDHIRTEKQYLSAFKLLVDSGIKSQQIRTYVLIGYDDTPEDARYRLEKIRSLDALPNPMRYQPIDAKRKNEYVSPNWNERLLKDYMRYWARQNWLSKIPFDDYLEEMK